LVGMDTRDDSDAYLLLWDFDATLFVLTGDAFDLNPGFRGVGVAVVCGVCEFLFHAAYEWLPSCGC
jgi:hypothetical protein